MILLSDRPGTPQDKMDVASGGHVEHLKPSVLLNRGNGPEQQELFRLIGVLVETDQYDERSMGGQL
jgi:hypothetical protein